MDITPGRVPNASLLATTAYKNLMNHKMMMETASPLRLASGLWNIIRAVHGHYGEHNRWKIA